eukprot:gene5959-6902_t
MPLTKDGDQIIIASSHRTRDAQTIKQTPTLEATPSLSPPRNIVGVISTTPQPTSSTPSLTTSYYPFTSERYTSSSASGHNTINYSSNPTTPLTQHLAQLHQQMQPMIIEAKEEDMGTSPPRYNISSPSSNQFSPSGGGGTEMSSPEYANSGNNNNNHWQSPDNSMTSYRSSLTSSSSYPSSPPSNCTQTIPSMSTTPHNNSNNNITLPSTSSIINPNIGTSNSNAIHNSLSGIPNTLIPSIPAAFGVMPNEQETWIEIRDLSSEISKIAKSSLTHGISEEILTEIKDKGLELLKMIETVAIKEKLDRKYDEDRNRIWKKKKLNIDFSASANNSPAGTPVTKAANASGSTTPGGPSTPVTPGTGAPVDPNMPPLQLVEPKKKTGDTPFCTSCGTTQTPEWRKGPAGGKSLCNACGLHYAKLMKKDIGVKSEPKQGKFQGKLQSGKGSDSIKLGDLSAKIIGDMPSISSKLGDLNNSMNNMNTSMGSMSGGSSLNNSLSVSAPSTNGILRRIAVTNNVQRSMTLEDEQVVPRGSNSPLIASCKKRMKLR